MIRVLRLLGLALLAFCAPALAVEESSNPRLAALVESIKADMLQDPRVAAKRAREGSVEFERLADRRARDTARATLLWLEAEGLARAGDLENADPVAKRALAMVRQAAPRSKLEGDILLARGGIAGARTDVSTALNSYQQAHRIFGAVRDARKQAIALVSLGLLYVDAHDYDAALKYLNEALEAYPADPGLAHAIYNSRGLIHQEKKQFDRADKDFRIALRFARQVAGRSVESTFLRNIARNELLAGRTGAAQRTIAQARALGTGERSDQAQLDAVAAQAALQQGRVEAAGKLIERAFAGLDLQQTDIAFRDAHQTAVAVYQKQQKPALALAHLQALKRLDDQATRLAAQANTALMAARFNSANQEAKIARLRDAERLRRAREQLERARTERTLWLVGAGATGTIIVLLLISIQVVRRSRDQVRAANADLAVTNSALAKALAAKTEFLATTSHEIRTPLNGILGMTQVMLTDRALAPATRDRLTVVHGAGLTMRALVDDILDVAKMETGNLGLEVAPFDLRAMLTDASRMWADQASAKGLTFAVELDRCPERVEGDAARVRQIVFNLLSNACKFTSQGSVTLSAEASEAGVLIRVADTGIGIAPEQREAVFESFRQADASTTRKFGGTGLGLSICRNLARAMDGDVTLASTPGEGSTFTVALPLPVVAAPAPASATPSEGEALLVIDRNPIARAMMRTLFAPHAGKVLFAAGPAEAVECLSAGGIARVLIDDATARADGDPHGVVAQVVEQAQGAKVALLWPKSEEADHAALLDLGIDLLIAKPITGAALVQQLFPTESAAEQQSSLVPRAA
jgi:signal transduction histidine kinase/CheY-like chemotaxis protein